jgi:RibD C-terminal domain
VLGLLHSPSLGQQQRPFTRQPPQHPRSRGFRRRRSKLRQYLVAGLVDEMEINLVPTLLGSGEALFDGVGDDLRGLELVRTVAAPKVTHLKFAKR